MKYLVNTRHRLNFITWALFALILGRKVRGNVSVESFHKIEALNRGVNGTVISASSDIECARMCGRDDTCASFTYNVATNVCEVSEKVMAGRGKDTYVKRTESTGIPVGYVYDTTYQFFYRTDNTTLRSHNQQREICEAEGGHLITIIDRDMFDWLVERTIKVTKCDGDCAFAIDGTDEGHEGIWTTYTNESLPWTEWNGGQPDNYNQNEHCLLLWNDKIGFNDGPCTWVITYFTCQIDRE